MSSIDYSVNSVYNCQDIYNANPKRGLESPEGRESQSEMATLTTFTGNLHLPPIDFYTKLKYCSFEQYLAVFGYTFKMAANDDKKANEKSNEVCYMNRCLIKTH